MLLALCLLGGIGIGLFLGLEARDPPRRYDHWHTRTTLVLIHTHNRHQKPVIVQFDDNQWAEAEDVLLEEFSQGTLRLPDLDNVERCRRFIQRTAR